jgi:hypothetical protein
MMKFNAWLLLSPPPAMIPPSLRAISPTQHDRPARARRRPRLRVRRQHRAAPVDKLPSLRPVRRGMAGSTVRTKFHDLREGGARLRKLGHFCNNHHATHQNRRSGWRSQPTEKHIRLRSPQNAAARHLPHPSASPSPPRTPPLAALGLALLAIRRRSGLLGGMA